MRTERGDFYSNVLNPRCRNQFWRFDMMFILYKQRNLIERCFNRLKQFRRFSTGYCGNIGAFRTCAALACAWLRLQLYVDTAWNQSHE